MKMLIELEYWGNVSWNYLWDFITNVMKMKYRVIETNKYDGSVSCTTKSNLFANRKNK